MTSVLITDANAGIGKGVARQHPCPGTKRVYLACRDETKATAAEQELEPKTGKSCFHLLLMAVSDLASVRFGMRGLAGPFDVLAMNAGGSGGKLPLSLTRNGVT